MNLDNLTKEDRELVEAAKTATLKFKDVKWRDKNISSVGAAVRTPDGKIYTGADISHPLASGTSICAEQTALAQIYSDGKREVDTVTAYWVAPSKNYNDEVMPPCGRCRDFLRLFGNPWVILQADGEIKKLRLSELLPYPDAWVQ